MTQSGHPYIGVSCYLEDSQGAAQAVALAKETGTRLRPQRPGGPFFKRSKSESENLFVALDSNSYLHVSVLKLCTACPALQHFVDALWIIHILRYH